MKTKNSLHLEEVIQEYEIKLQKERERVDVLIHQIQLDADRKVIEFKHLVFKRLIPQLDDLTNVALGEYYYASAEKGRKLYQRLQDIIRILRDLGILPS
jgi:hypothetical protein